MLGVQKFLQFIYDNLTTILVCIGLVIGIIKKIKDYHSKSTEEKVAIAKAQIHEAMLKLIGTADGRGMSGRQCRIICLPTR